MHLNFEINNRIWGGGGGAGVTFLAYPVLSKKYHVYFYHLASNMESTVQTQTHKTELCDNTS